MKNTDNINMLQLHLEILLQAEENEVGDVHIYGYSHKAGSGCIKFCCQSQNYTMIFENGILTEIKKGLR
jgi:hypothetical protein